MIRGNLKKVFISSFFILLGFIFGLGVSVLAWVNPSQNPPLGGGVLQTDTSGLKIVTTTQITTGNFTVNQGNVGIGTTAPIGKLHVKTHIYDVVGNVSGWQNPRCSCDISSSITDCPAWWETSDPDGTICYDNYTYGGYPYSYKFVAKDWFMVISSGGVGIGTITPDAKLHIYGGRLAITGAGGGTNTGQIRIDRFPGETIGWYIYARESDNAFIIQHGLNTRFGILPEGNIYIPGNVGIGTTAPGYNLDIAGALRLQPSSAPTGANGVIYYDSTANKFKCYEGGTWKDCISAGGGFWAVSGANIYNTNTGNVGIGTTNPQAKLDVAGNVKIGSSSTTCDANHRGEFRFELGVNYGEDDQLYMCMRDSTGAFIWVLVARGGFPGGFPY
jgi:hypothetical protein